MKYRKIKSSRKTGIRDNNDYFIFRYVPTSAPRPTLPVSHSFRSFDIYTSIIAKINVFTFWCKSGTVIIISSMLF